MSSMTWTNIAPTIGIQSKSSFQKFGLASLKYDDIMNAEGMAVI